MEMRPKPYVTTTFPHFVKIMLPSHASSAFWLGLPSSFCRIHLPKDEVTIILEDADGREFTATYLGTWAAISAGWRGFCSAHNLSIGDILAFELVRPLKFKVHILGSMDSTEANGYLNLLRSCSSFKEVNSEKDLRVSKLETDNGCKLVVGKSKRKFEVLKQERELQPSIPTTFPSFERLMVPSHISYGFFRRLPSDFCNIYLPKEDVTVILEGDDEKEYNVKYLSHGVALSGGWKAFSDAH